MWHEGGNGCTGLGERCVVTRKLPQGEGSRRAETWIAGGFWMATVGNAEEAPVLVDPKVTE